MSKKEKKSAKDSSASSPTLASPVAEPPNEPDVSPTAGGGGAPKAKLVATKTDLLRLKRFYAQYCPDKTSDDVKAMLREFGTSEERLAQLWKKLVKKYGPEPPADGDTAAAAAAAVSSSSAGASPTSPKAAGSPKKSRAGGDTDRASAAAMGEEDELPAPPGDSGKKKKSASSKAGAAEAGSPTSKAGAPKTTSPDPNPDMEGASPKLVAAIRNETLARLRRFYARYEPQLSADAVAERMDKMKLEYGTFYNMWAELTAYYGPEPPSPAPSPDRDAGSPVKGDPKFESAFPRPADVLRERQATAALRKQQAAAPTAPTALPAPSPHASVPVTATGEASPLDVLVALASVRDETERQNRADQAIRSAAAARQAANTQPYQLFRDPNSNPLNNPYGTAATSTTAAVPAPKVPPSAAFANLSLRIFGADYALFLSAAEGRAAQGRFATALELDIATSLGIAPKFVRCTRVASGGGSCIVAELAVDIPESDEEVAKYSAVEKATTIERARLAEEYRERINTKRSCLRLILDQLADAVTSGRFAAPRLLLSYEGDLGGTPIGVYVQSIAIDGVGGGNSGDNSGSAEEERRMAIQNEIARTQALEAAADARLRSMAAAAAIENRQQQSDGTDSSRKLRTDGERFGWLPPDNATLDNSRQPQRFGGRVATFDPTVRERLILEEREQALRQREQALAEAEARAEARADTLRRLQQVEGRSGYEAVADFYRAENARFEQRLREQQHSAEAPPMSFLERLEWTYEHDRHRSTVGGNMTGGGGGGGLSAQTSRHDGSPAASAPHSGAGSGLVGYRSMAPASGLPHGAVPSAYDYYRGAPGTAALERQRAGMPPPQQQREQQPSTVSIDRDSYHPSPYAGSHPQSQSHPQQASVSVSRTDPRTGITTTYTRLTGGGGDPQGGLSSPGSISGAISVGGGGSQPRGFGTTAKAQPLMATAAGHHQEHHRLYDDDHHPLPHPLLNALAYRQPSASPVPMAPR